MRRVALIAVLALPLLSAPPAAAADYRGALAALCVKSGATLDAVATPSYATRVARASSVLAPLRTGAKALTPPGDLVVAHAQFVRGLDGLLSVTRAISGELAHGKPAVVVKPYAAKLTAASKDLRTALSAIALWPCSELIASTNALIAFDTARPTVKAIASSGSKGTAISLRYTIADNSRGARPTIVVYQAGKVLRRTVGPFGDTVSGTVLTTTFAAPAAPKGALRFCVTARDRAGNTSKQSCAAITVR